MTISRHAYAICGILAILTAASLGAGHAKKAANNPLQVVVVNPANSPAQISGLVTVANTSTNPIPVSPQGTTTVSGTVNVGNTRSNPVVTTNAREVFSIAYDLGIPDGLQSAGQNAFTVPDGKTLVVTNEYIVSDLPSGESLLKVTLNVNGQFIPIEFSHTGTDGVKEYFTGRSSGDIYIPGGSGAGISGYRNSATGDALVTVGFNGYLVDNP